MLNREWEHMMQRRRCPIRSKSAQSCKVWEGREGWKNLEHFAINCVAPERTKLTNQDYKSRLSSTGSLVVRPPHWSRPPLYPSYRIVEVGQLTMWDPPTANPLDLMHTFSVDYQIILQDPKGNFLFDSCKIDRHLLRWSENHEWQAQIFTLNITAGCNEMKGLGKTEN